MRRAAAVASPNHGRRSACRSTTDSTDRAPIQARAPPTLSLDQRRRLRIFFPFYGELLNNRTGVRSRLYTHPPVEMAACDKTLAVALLLFFALASTAALDASLYDSVDNSCYCHCMIDRCMAAPDATREECGTSCDAGCIKSGRPGRIDGHDFCGY
ncbi:hypothetical protein ZIOFF_058386 [Zingiber officinale]|uniref:Uncharacterized protein n=1 Tax=Zingiber officinale TaxID=94328 RepID=A0A8J5F7K9_ZINOF|nr:hypothetical protein ZIOFF_058386 [Zingiber officinale]